MDLDRVDVEHMLSSLGVRNLARQGNEWIFSCPFPGHAHGDLTPSAAMNEKTTAWNCFSCKRRGNAITFVMEYEEVSPMVARRMLREAYGAGFIDPTHSGGLAREIEMLFALPAKSPDKNEPISEDHLHRFAIDWDAPSAAREYMVGARGFTPEILRKFEIGFYTPAARVTIPIRNVFGELVGFKGRAIYPDQQPRYLVLGDTERVQGWGFKPYAASLECYLLHACEPAEGEVLIVCEGELNALKLRQYGYHWTAAVSGSTMSLAQANQIVWAAEQVILYYDSNLAGMNGLREAAELLHDRIRTRLIKPHRKDPAASTQEEVDDLLDDTMNAFDALTFHPQFFIPID